MVLRFGRDPFSKLAPSVDLHLRGLAIGGKVHVLGSEDPGHC